MKKRLVPITTLIIGTILITLGFIVGQIDMKQNQIIKHDVIIQTTQGKTTVTVEVASTDEQRQKGLMYRKSLPAKQGMLFLLPYPQIVRMWMKNTYIPLDMLFIRDNQVVALHQNARPLDETLITSPDFATAVIEVNAGTVQKYGIKVGDKVSF